MDHIVQALSQLDVNNDNHWTEQGLPRIETMKFMTGEQNLTREQLTNAAPEFNRETAVEFFNGGGDDDGDTDIAGASDPDSDNDPEVEEGASTEIDLSGLPDQGEYAKMSKEEAEKELVSLNRQRVVIAQHLTEVQARLDYFTIVEASKPEQKHKTARQMQGYLKQQQADREAIAEQLKEKGLDPASAQSVLDSAFARKTQRGRERPRFGQQAPQGES